MDVNLIKNDYLNLLSNKFNYLCYNMENINKIANCKFVLDTSKGIGASTEFGNPCVITYGDKADEITIFHELEHIRKGKPITKTQEEFVESKSEPNHIHINEPRYGIFFDEAITEYLAMLLFISSSYYQPEIDEKKVDKRYEMVYNNNLIILRKLSKMLKLDQSKLCELIELKHHKNDNTIDKRCEMITGEKDFFQIMERKLDYVGSAQFANWHKQGSQGCSKEVMANCDKYLKQVIDRITSFIQVKF